MKPVRKLVWGSLVLAALVVTIALAFFERPLSFFNGLLYFQMATAGAHSKQVMVGGHRIHYYTEGSDSGLPVVLVHGLGGRSEDWRRLAPWMVAGGFHVYMPDLPGYGRSEKPADFSYSIGDEANAVVGFMNAMGLRQVYLGGWAMGGWIVQRIAAEHPDRVARLMLFDSAGLYEKPAWDTRLFTPTTAAELAQLDTLLMPNPPNVPGFIASDILRTSGEHAWVIHRALASMLTGKDATDAILPQLKMPVLLVWGGADHITPLAQGEKMHKLIPQSQLAVFPACGHLAPVQCADQMANKVVDFLR